MTVQVLNLRTLRVDAEVAESLDLLARWQSLSRVQVIQRLLSQGARQARLEYAARLYGNGEVTLERAAELAGVTIYDMMAHVRSLNITPPSDLTELRADVAGMLSRLGYSDLAKQVQHREGMEQASPRPARAAVLQSLALPQVRESDGVQYDLAQEADTEAS